MLLKPVVAFQRLREPGTRSAAIIMVVETALLLLSGSALLVLTALGRADNEPWLWALVSVIIASALLKLIPPLDEIKDSMVVDASELSRPPRTLAERRAALAEVGLTPENPR
jgi:hypothetical protein